MEEKLLLEPIRQMKAAFLSSDGLDHALEEGIREVAQVTGSAAYMVDKGGKVLAGYAGDIEPDSHLQHLVEKGAVTGDPGLEEMVQSGEPLLNAPYPGSDPQDKGKQTRLAEKKMLYTVVPIKSNGKLLGSLLLYHPGQYFEERHHILAEVASALVGVILLQASVGQEEEDTRNKELAAGAFDSLSYSEVEAIREILKNIDNNESIVVASKIADSLGITRSVIVNALRKFESAGIIESRSLGMKGTLIRVKNVHALELVATRSANMDSIR